MEMSFNVTSLIWKRLDVIHNRIMIECMCERELGPSEQLIEDAKDQSAHHCKDARR